LNFRLNYLPRLARFNYLEPGSIKEACVLLDKYRDRARVLAGGTDLLVSMKRGKISPDFLINIKRVPALDYIYHDKQENGLIRVGALSSLHSVASSPVINNEFGLLATACNKIGIPQVRNMGTIGGNICNAGPSQDSIPALLVLDARLRLVSLQGERIIPIDQFFVGPFQTALNDVELLTEIEIPKLPPRSDGCYRWLTKRTEADETLVGVAVLMSLDPTGNYCEDIKIGLCSVGPPGMRAKKAEVVLRDQAIGISCIEETAQVAASEAEPRSRANYRRQMTAILVKRSLSEVWQRIKKAIDDGGVE
jgi:CO/xanthine dehydrogenase FAD-binding subunit